MSIKEDIEEALPNCKYIERLGRGGFGAVFKVKNRLTGLHFAVKVLEEGAKEEAQRLMDLEPHPNVVRILDVKEDKFLLMDLVKGETLRDVLTRRGPLKPEAWFPYFQGILNGLSHLHAGKVVHRDVKPENIIVNENGECVLIDLGAARKEGRETSYTGTYRYSAPESLPDPIGLGGAPRRSWDIYSLSVVAFEMLYGCVPSSGPKGSFVEVTDDDREKMMDRLRKSEVGYVRAIREGLDPVATHRPKSIFDWLCSMVVVSMRDAKQDDMYYAQAVEIRSVFMKGDWKKKDVLGAIVDEMKLAKRSSSLYEELRKKKKASILQWLVDEHAKLFVKWAEESVECESMRLSQDTELEPEPEPESEPKLADLRKQISTDIKIPLRSITFYRRDKFGVWTKANGGARRDIFFEQWGYKYHRNPELLPESIDDETVAELRRIAFRIYGLPEGAFEVVKPPPSGDIYNGNTGVRRVRAEWQEIDAG